MAHYIDKDALVAEIRSRLHPTVVPHGTHYDDWDNGADCERIRILSFIDTLEVKEVDLEKEINDYHITKKPTVWFNTLEEIAKHFFELGLKVQKGE